MSTIQSLFSKKLKTLLFMVQKGIVPGTSTVLIQYYILISNPADLFEKKIDSGSVIALIRYLIDLFSLSNTLKILEKEKKER